MAVSAVSFKVPVVQALFVAPQRPFTAQAWVLHAWELAPTQSAPPFAGAGFVQVRACVPPPQVTEHVDQLDHPPFTGMGSVQLAVVPPFAPTHCHK